MNMQPEIAARGNFQFFSALIIAPISRVEKYWFDFHSPTMVP